MNLVDLILIVLLALSVIAGYRDGFVKEFASLAGLIIGIYVALHFSDVTADFIRDFIGVSGKYLKIISFVLTLVLVIVVFSLLGKILESVIETIMLGFLNRIAGAVFGLLKGMLILSLVIMLLNFIKVEDKLISPNKQQGSRFYGDVKDFAPFVFRFFDLDEKMDELTLWEKEDETSPKAV